jgi:hypothetical protein
MLMSGEAAKYAAGWFFFKHIDEICICTGGAV